MGGGGGVLDAAISRCDVPDGQGAVVLAVAVTAWTLREGESMGEITAGKSGAASAGVGRQLVR